MRIVHICDGWEETNGAAVIARMLADEQRTQGHEVSLRRWAPIGILRAADEVWIHCGWKPCLIWASVWARHSVRMPEACYDPVRLAYHGWKKRIVGPVERACLRMAERCVATCGAEAGWVRSYEPRVKSVVIEDIKRFFALPESAPQQSKLERPLHLLYLGRCHPLKGVECLRRAVEGRKDVELHVVSGAVGEEKERVWKWCDTLVLPTYSDNFGLVVAEALSRGKRVVVTDGAPAWADDPRVTYVRGFRDGSAEDRVRLLRKAI